MSASRVSPSDRAADRLRIRLRVPSPPGRRWGDYYFARSLADALERRGHGVLMDFAHRQRWRAFLAGLRRAPDADIDLVLRGKVARVPHPGRPTLMWLISNAGQVTRDELGGMAHVFVASRHWLRRLQEEGRRNVSLLLQCTDSTIFAPNRRSEGHRSHVLFVANRRDFERKALTYALRAGLPVRVWGKWSRETLPPGVHTGSGIANDELGIHYASADVVLNDHTPDMLENRFTSNRVFDVLASGAPLLTDAADDLPPELAEMAYVFSGYESFLEGYRAATAEGPERKARRKAVAELVRTEHSFDARALEIETVARTVLAGVETTSAPARPEARPRVAGAGSLPS